MPRARINDLSVHFQQVGHGPDLVLVHGLFCNLAFWYLTVVPKLADHFRVTMYDLRGHGFSDGHQRGYRPIDLAGDLLALMDHLDIAVAHLAGHSFGGAVALAAAVHHEDRVNSLSLADAWLPSLQPAPLSGNSAVWQETRRRLQASGFEVDENTPRVAHTFLEEFLADAPSAADGPAADHAFGLLTPVAGKTSLAHRRWSQLLRTSRAMEEMSDATGIEAADISTCGRRPIGLIFGGRSRFLPTMHSLRRLLPKVHTIIVPDAGHFFPIRRPQIFVNALTRLTGVAAPRYPVSV